MSTVLTSERLFDVLSAMTVESLKPLARRCASNLPTRKGELVQAIYQALQSPEFVAAQLRQADETTRLALAEAAHRNGVLDQARFEAKFGRKFGAPAHSPSRSDGRRSDSTGSVAALFLYNGRVPTDLISLLKKLLPAPAPFVIPSRNDLPEEAVGIGNEPIPLTSFLTEEPALHDLLATLTLVGQGKAAVSEATQQPTAATVRLLRERSLLPDVIPAVEGARADDAIRPFALTMIVQAASLAKAKGTRLELTGAGQAALDQPTVDLLKWCWESWTAWDKLDELARVRGIKGQKARGPRLSPASERKEALAEALASCPPGRWILMEDFFRHVRAGEHDFAVDTSDYTRLYVGYSREDGWLGYAGTDLWRVVNAAYIRVVLLEYAATLGLIDVATIPSEDAKLDFHLDWEIEENEFSRYTGLIFFRINNLGSYILELSDGYSGPALPVEQPVLTVLPSLDVVVADRAGLSPNDRVTLERFTTRTSDDVYKLSRDRLLEAAEAGFGIADAEAFLRRRGQHDLPQTTQTLFQDVARGVAAVQSVTAAFVIQCADSHVAQLIAHDSGLSKLCLLAGETRLVIPDKQLAAFRRGLRRLGFVLSDDRLSAGVGWRKPRK